ncbi:MAG: hypothetical protein NTU45_04315 [Planctomycetota bacterium]|jgi:hypothetical protein|nr:hypothetical protein [Planctomycetota bacterium]
MNRTNRFSRALASAITAALTCLVVADTGSPPPPSLSVASLVTVSRVQSRTFFGQVLPSYQAWLSAGARPNTYPAFMLFVSAYPCSPADRVAYAYLYLEAFPP